MAAASVMSDPSKGATMRMVIHHAIGVPRPSRAMRSRMPSAKCSTGRVDANAMITTTNSGSE